MKKHALGIALAMMAAQAQSNMFLTDDLPIDTRKFCYICKEPHAEKTKYCAKESCRRKYKKQD